MQGSLKDLITSLEWGTKLHISVVFLGEHGNDLTCLPEEKRIHKTEICDTAKSTADSYTACVDCRNTVLKRVVRTGKTVSGCCINGIYEYCHPVVKENDVVCVIFIGHILNRSCPNHKRLYKHFSDRLISTLQADFGEDDCRRTAEIIEGYILFLLEKFGDGVSTHHDLLIENIKAYIEENLIDDLSMKELAYFFGYNEKYLGRLFKRRSGQTVKEYCNSLRIDKARHLLTITDKKVSEIAGMVGFNNVTYFNKLFRQIVGTTPEAYKKSKDQGKDESL